MYGSTPWLGRRPATALGPGSLLAAGYLNGPQSFRSANCAARVSRLASWIAEFRPSFLCSAIEINMMGGAEPKRFDQLVILAERVYARLKAKHPKLLIFPTFQIDFGVAGNPGGEQAVRRLMPYSDAIAVSTYPHLRGFTPETLPKGWLADVRTFVAEKIQNLGHHCPARCGASG
jgi:hypothetical protein